MTEQETAAFDGTYAVVIETEKFLDELSGILLDSQFDQIGNRLKQLRAKIARVRRKTKGAKKK